MSKDDFNDLVVEDCFTDWEEPSEFWFVEQPDDKTLDKYSHDDIIECIK